MKYYKLRIQSLLLFPVVLLIFVQYSIASESGDKLQMEHSFRITEGLRSPLRIAIDDLDIVYVTDAIGGKICRYDSTGAFLGEIIASSSPLAITVTPQHHLYIGDKESGELQLFNVNGQLMKKITSDFGGFELASCAVMDDENRLYVVDGVKKRISIFNENGDFVSSFGDSILIFPTGIAFDNKNQRILVSEHGGLQPSAPNLEAKMIHVFDKQGTWQKSFGEYGNEEGQFTRIQGLEVDHFGRIYAADTFQGMVTVLSEEGEFLTTIGQFGTEPGELRAPFDVAIDSRGRLWVVSMNNGSLEVFGGGDIPTPVSENQESEPIIPSRSNLLQNYPNPFNPGTWIPFVLEKDSPVVIRIYNEMGQLIRSFDMGKLRRGSYTGEGNSVYWDGKNSAGEVVASGIYIYEIRAEDFVAVRRMLMLK